MNQHFRAHGAPTGGNEPTSRFRFQGGPQQPPPQSPTLGGGQPDATGYVPGSLSAAVRNGQQFGPTAMKAGLNQAAGLPANTGIDKGPSASAQGGGMGAGQQTPGFANFDGGRAAQMFGQLAALRQAAQQQSSQAPRFNPAMAGNRAFYQPGYSPYGQSTQMGNVASHYGSQK